ncbi:hypothetical protein ACFC8F_03030 [Streptomyces hydrogenans]|uniref:hypothetical protein n=1 Tax=Streptomyces hydrogenans TaxID=1873719 RepID=UPI0035E2ACC9
MAVATPEIRILLVRDVSAVQDVVVGAGAGAAGEDSHVDGVAGLAQAGAGDEETGEFDPVGHDLGIGEGRAVRHSRDERQEN